MAWADIAALSPGDPMQLQHFLDIRLALIERCEWAGNATQKAAAQALSTTNPFNAAWLNSARAICEAIDQEFYRGSAYWQDSGFQGYGNRKQVLYNTYGEASGFGLSGGTYNWILRPTRAGSLVLGQTMPQNTYHPFLEHLMGLYYYINDTMRWIGTTIITGSSMTKRKRGSASPSDNEAWTSMKGATPEHYAYGVAALLGIYWWNNLTPPNIYRYYDYRRLEFRQWLNTPLATLAGFDACSFIYKIRAGESLGPWKLCSGATGTDAGAYAGPPVLHSSFTFSAWNTYNKFDCDNPGNLGGAASANWYDLIYNPAYDGGAGPGAMRRAYFDVGGMIAKPQTSYGT